MIDNVEPGVLGRALSERSVDIGGDQQGLRHEPQDKLNSLRFLRKHSTAFIALGVYHFVFFFPTLFMQRVPSPNDVFFNYAPWSSVHSVEVQNSLINDPPTSYFTLMSMLKRDRGAFHWNPYIGSGVPGFGSSASAVLSPFISLPTLLLPLAWVYAGIVLLKLNASFFFAYCWLREERLGRRGAAVGAIVIAAAGVYAVRWWWQATNATALYPALLWIVVRTMRGRRVPVAATIAVVVIFLIAGFPAAILYGIYAALAYAIALAVVCRRRPALQTAIAIVLAAVIAAPFIVPFVQFLKRSGYLEARIGAAQQTFPLRHLASFVFPDRLGNNAYHSWSGDGALGAANNYLGATVYLGLLPLLLMGVALWNRRARMRWFWGGALVFVLLAMFGVKPVSSLTARLPYMTYSPLTQLSLLLPVPVGYLAAAAASRFRRRTLVVATIAALSAADLGVFAGRFYPYIDPHVATPPITPVIAYLKKDRAPFRVAAFMNYMWPNTSELFGLEDVRSHFSSERDYRRLLLRIDPSSSSDRHTVLSFNSLQFNFSDPFTAMLGVRYYLEHREIDIIRWTIFKNSEPVAPSNGVIALKPGMSLQRTIHVDARPFYALDIPVTLRTAMPAASRLVVSLSRGGRVLYTRAFTPADIAALNKVFVPIYEFLRAGDDATLDVRSVGMTAELVRGSDDPLYYDRVTIPLMFDRELPDGRIFRNAGEVPRFHSVKRVSHMTHDEFLAKTMSTDFRDEAVVTGYGQIPSTSDADVVLRRYAADEQWVDVDAPAGTFLVSSEKLTPELRVTVDGRKVTPMETNLLFAGVSVPPGRHTVVFTRRLARGWWIWSAIALLAAVAWSIVESTRRYRAAR
jgi:hypothetical protein